MDDWYVIQVQSGKEEHTAALCRSIVSEDMLSDCFIPYYERMKRYRGRWHKEKAVMFPGYVFVISDNIEELWMALKKVPKLTRILRNDMEFIPLSSGEVGLIQCMCGKDYIAGMSEGYTINDKVYITSGPMVDMQGIILKIDRHKRLATVQIDMFGRTVEVQMGLEIVQKIEEHEEENM